MRYNVCVRFVTWKNFCYHHDHGYDGRWFYSFDVSEVHVLLVLLSRSQKLHGSPTRWQCEHLNLFLYFRQIIASGLLSQWIKKPYSPCVHFCSWKWQIEHGNGLLGIICSVQLHEVHNLCLLGCVWNELMNHATYVFNVT